MALLTVGTLYIPNYNHIAWTQPGGTGTTVYPQQGDGPFLAYPVPGQFISEAGESLWRAGCGHGFDVWLVFRDYDSSTSSSVAVVCCPLCTYIMQLIEPYELWTNPVEYPILVG